MPEHFYLTRDHQFVPVELLRDGPLSREIRFIQDVPSFVEPSADNPGPLEAVAVPSPTAVIHPDGVAWGRMYPRLFRVKEKPAGFFIHRGRVLPNVEGSAIAQAAIPAVDPGYRFQSFLSDVIDSIHARENVLLTGGTGVGKTTHIVQLAARVGQPLLRINFNGETRMSDLLGKVQVIAGETRWLDGVLPQAMRNGWWLLLDELDFADPAVLSLLHPVLEDDPILVIKENRGEIIRPHHNFRLFATANSIGAMESRASSYSGTNQMNGAFIDRWQVVFVANLSEREELKVLRMKVPGLRARVAKKIVDFAAKARANAFSDGTAFTFEEFSTRKVLAWSRKAALHRSALKGAHLSWLDKIPSDDREYFERLLATHFGGARKRARKRTSGGV